MLERRRFLSLFAAPLLGWGCDRAEPPAGLRPEDRFPALELQDLEGGVMHLPVPGFPCLINVWATWCPPCRAEMAGLERVSQRFAADGLRVIGVSVDSDLNLVREYLLKVRLSFPVVLDRGGDLVRSRLGVSAYPYTALVGAGGLINATWLGEQDWDHPAMQPLLRQLVAGRRA